MSPVLISNEMLGDVRNLNKISHDTATGLIEQALKDGNNITEVYIDTVGTPEYYLKLLHNHFGSWYPEIKFVVESKADANYKTVSAASIIAKYWRDKELDDWEYLEKGLGISEEEIRKVGCGYPGDEETKRWLTNTLDDEFGFPTIVWFSWSTCKNLITNKIDNKENPKCLTQNSAVSLWEIEVDKREWLKNEAWKLKLKHFPEDP